MKVYSAQELIEFENEVASIYDSGSIKAPVHLYNGNEDQLIKIFEQIKDEDWVFCTWRSHYQCLLKGVPKDLLLADIVKGKSITLNYPDYKIYSSAIVTGTIPIANGVAFGEKLKNSNSKIWCFVGDMASETGAFFENWKYAVNFDLPITFIIEDNNKSVCTDTRLVWNSSKLFFEQEKSKIIYYKYESKYPHAGAGKRIQF